MKITEIKVNWSEVIAKGEDNGMTFVGKVEVKSPLYASPKDLHILKQAAIRSMAEAAADAAYIEYLRVQS